jgi:hypothetical protein
MGATTMDARAATLAWGLWGAFIALTVATAAIVVLGGVTVGELAAAVIWIPFVTSGALIASRRPGNAVGWILLASAVGFSVYIAAESWALTGRAGSTAAAWVASWLFRLWFGVPAFILPLLFPDGRSPPRGASAGSPRARRTPWRRASSRRPAA